MFANKFGKLFFACLGFLPCSVSFALSSQSAFRILKILSEPVCRAVSGSIYLIVNTHILYIDPEQLENYGYTSYFLRFQDDMTFLFFCNNCKFLYQKFFLFSCQKWQQYMTNMFCRVMAIMNIALKIKNLSRIT